MKSIDFDCSIRVKPGKDNVIEVIDQRFLPFRSGLFEIRSEDDAAFAIREMVVRGAPLIGVTAAFGMYLAVRNCGKGSYMEALDRAEALLNSTRPTAINLFYATLRMKAAVEPGLEGDKASGILFREAAALMEEEIEACRMIGVHGLVLIEEVFRKNGGKTVQVLTHCNAGWLACVKWGTATAPIYMAHQQGIPLHVWVDETRPRNQGARLTAYELGIVGIPHTVIPDNAGGHLMQHGLVDLVITGSDRTTANGDVANKIGTYLKALAAYDNRIPFYVALPVSSIDRELEEGVQNIPVEERSPDEVHFTEGWTGSEIGRVRVTPFESRAANYGFDVTPARLVTRLITERGICPATREGISSLFTPAGVKDTTDTKE